METLAVLRQHQEDDLHGAAAAAAGAAVLLLVGPGGDRRQRDDVAVPAEAVGARRRVQLEGAHGWKVESRLGPVPAFLKTFFGFVISGMCVLFGPRTKFTLSAERPRKHVRLHFHQLTNSSARFSPNLTNLSACAITFRLFFSLKPK